MEMMSMQISGLQSTQLNYGCLLPPSGRMRKRCTQDPCIYYTRSQDKVNLRAVPLRYLSRPSTVPRFSTLNSTERNLTDASLCESDVAQDEHALLLKKRANERVADLRGTCIYLIGMMGSGKTTVGKLLADALDYHFFDSDKLIEEAAGGISVAQIFKEHSEEGFRDAETEVLQQLSCRGRLVVATGGGIVVRPINWSYLRHGVTVWLDVPLEALAARVVAAGTESRPLLGHSVAETAHSKVIAIGTESRPLLGHSVAETAHSKALAKLSNIFKVRGPFYGDADLTVSLEELAARLGHENVSALTPTMIAVEVLEGISKLILLKKRKDAASAA